MRLKSCEEDFAFKDSILVVSAGLELESLGFKSFLSTFKVTIGRSLSLRLIHDTKFL